MADQTQADALQQVAVSLTRAQRSVVESGVPYERIPANIMPGLYFYGLVDGEANDWTPLGRAMIQRFQDNGIENAQPDASQAGEDHE